MLKKYRNPLHDEVILVTWLVLVVVVFSQRVKHAYYLLCYRPLTFQAVYCMSLFDWIGIHLLK